MVTWEYKVAVINEKDWGGYYAYKRVHEHAMTTKYSIAKSWRSNKSQLLINLVPCQTHLIFTENILTRQILLVGEISRRVRELFKNKCKKKNYEIIVVTVSCCNVWRYTYCKVLQVQPQSLNRITPLHTWLPILRETDTGSLTWTLSRRPNKQYPLQCLS